MYPESMPRISRATQDVAGALHKIFDKTYIQPDLCFAVTKDFALVLDPRPHILPSSHGLNDGKRSMTGPLNEWL